MLALTFLNLVVELHLDCYVLLLFVQGGLRSD